VSQQVGWLVPSGHNGLLDIILDLGNVGLAIFIAGYVILCSRALRLMRKTLGAVPIWLCSYLVFMLLYSLTESTILHQNNIFWILYSSTAVCVSLYARDPLGHHGGAPMQANCSEQIAGEWQRKGLYQI
jgi:O-antigen ligase